jgi:hypothetical protein
MVLPMGRSRRGKTVFECGHRGFGKACRRCIDADKMEARAKHLRKASAERQALLQEAARLRTLDGVAPKEAPPKEDESEA